jgi:hypothetical protein
LTKIFVLVALALHEETVIKPKPCAPALKVAKTVAEAPAASVTLVGVTPVHVMLSVPEHVTLLVVVTLVALVNLNFAS